MGKLVLRDGLIEAGLGYELDLQIDIGDWRNRELECSSQGCVRVHVGRDILDQIRNRPPI